MQLINDIARPQSPMKLISLSMLDMISFRQRVRFIDLAEMR